MKTLIDRRKFVKLLKENGWENVENDCCNVYGEKTLYNEKFYVSAESIEKSMGKDVGLEAMKGWKAKVVGRINRRIPVRQKAYNILAKEIRGIIRKSLASKKDINEYNLYLKLQKKYEW